ncbi:MAG: tetratricopeptide repeat protein [Planctomycetota bacterium]|nr:tetratricopeptide repeat protein [Planctomycetota bacterium]
MPFRLVLILLAAVLAWGAAMAHAQGEVPARARAAYRALLRGDLSRADAESAEAVRESEQSAGAWSVRAYVLSHRGDKTGAAAAYRRAIELDPRDAAVRNNLGAVLLELGEVEGALVAVGEALRLRPDYADARNNQGAAYERQGRVDEARRAYTTATTLDPEHAQAHNNLGAVQLRTGDVQAAAASFARAAALDPEFAAPALNLALVGDSADRDDAYYARLEEAASRPGASAQLRARVLAMRAGREADAQRWGRARELYLDALRLAPRDTTLLNNVAVVEDQLGLDREALLHLTEALDIDPDLLVAQNNIGIVHVHRGDLELAQAVFESLVAQDPDFHRAHYNLGVIHASEGRVTEARRSFEQAARLAPRDASIRYNLALLGRRADGDVRAELQAYREVLRMDPDLTEAHLALGMLLADPSTPPRLRAPTEAERHLRRFLELAPETDDEGRTQADEWLAWLAANR